jgi:uncharacterized protein (DUF1499 family)
MTGGKKLFLFFCLASVFAISGCTGSVPANLGQLTPCPSSPNCVSTKSTDEEHSMNPIPYSGTLDNAQNRLLEIVQSLPRSQVVANKEDYLHVEFTSWMFRFVDDVEFFLNVEDAMIHFRSASRIGHSDLGVNRKRMETIRSRFFAADSPTNN